MTTDEMIRLYLAGDTMEAIAKAAGVSKQAVDQRLRPAKRSGVIPTDVRQGRSLAAAKANGTPETFRAAQAQRWGAQGYTPELRRLVGRAALARGVLPVVREWGLAESTVRAWRNELKADTDAG